MGLYLQQVFALSPVKDNDTVSRTAILTNQQTGQVGLKQLLPTDTSVSFVCRKSVPYSFTYYDTDGANNIGPQAPPLTFTATDVTPPQVPDIATLAGVATETDALPDA